MVSATTALQTRAAPFIPVGLSLDAGQAGSPAWASDLDSIRRLGFNSIVVRVGWSAAEPGPGADRLDGLDRRLADARRAGLQVIVRIDTDDAPDWVARTFPAGRVLSSEKAPVVSNGRPRVCLDHPGVRTAVLSFITRVVERAAAQPSVYAFDFSGGTGTPAAGSEAAICYCVSTSDRFRAFLREAYGSLDALNSAWAGHFTAWRQIVPPGPGAGGPGARVDWQTFNAARSRDHLRLMVQAAGPRGARVIFDRPRIPAVLLDARSAAGSADDWVMSGVVDRASASIFPRPAEQPAWTPVQLGLALDGVRSAARDRGWWAGALQGSGRTHIRSSESVTAADLRLWGWAAISRGARGLDYANLDLQGSHVAAAAGELSGNLTRNAALFAPLRPRPSHVAILYDRPSSILAGDAVRQSLVGLYQAMFERNIQVDFIHSNEVAAGYAGEYDAVCVGDGMTLSPPVDAALEAYVKGGGTVVRGPSDSRLNALIGAGDSRNGRLQPDIRIDRAHGLVEARVLESSDAIVILGLNHSDAPQRVTMQFAPDMPEAIWQNMESGASVNFVAGPEGPSYTHTFAPRDVLVLMIRKALRVP